MQQKIKNKKMVKREFTNNNNDMDQYSGGKKEDEQNLLVEVYSKNVTL